MRIYSKNNRWSSYKLSCAIALSLCFVSLACFGCRKLSAESKEYIFPTEMSSWYNCTAEETVSDMLSTPGHELFFSDIAANDDGTVSMWLTPEQEEHWEKTRIEWIEREEKSANGAVKVSYSSDYKAATISINPRGINEHGFVRMYGVLRECLLIMQIIKGATVDDWSITLTVEDMRTGKAVAKAMFPYESMTISPELWAEGDALEAENAEIAE